MEASQNFTYTPQSQPLRPPSQPPTPVSGNGFPMLPIAVLGIMATTFLLVSYYIFVTKCCFRWQQLDQLRRFSIRQRAHVHEDPLTSYSPSWQSRGLDELLIRELPTYQYSNNESECSRFSKCVVCLNKFQDYDMLRVLPKCSHAFHLDCIDIWLQNNSNCPLCRSTISGRNRYRVERILAPNSSPQDSQALFGNIGGGNEDFVVIELSGEDGTNMSQVRSHDSRSHSSRKTGKSKPRKFHHVSIMGDEGIDVREKDEQFSVEPIRRSFSMDSAADRHLYRSVQEILRQNNNRQISEVRNNGESSSSSRSRRLSIFSFGHGRGGPRNSVLPIEF